MATHKVHVFVDVHQNIYPSEEEYYVQIESTIKEIINTDIWFETNNNHKLLPFHTHKVLFIDDEYWVIHCFYLPKHWIVSKDCREKLKDVDFRDRCIRKLLDFYQYVRALHKEERTEEALLKRRDKGTQVIQPEKEFCIIHALYHHLKKKKYYQVEYLCSDQVVGYVDEELNKYHYQKNVRIQRIEVPEDEIYYIINSYLNVRYTQRYLLFLEEQKKEGLYPVYSKILRVLRLIKRHTKYDTQKRFYTKALLRQERAVVRKTDARLLSYLEKLLHFHEFYKKNTTIRRFVNIAHAWERHLNIHLFSGDRQAPKPSKAFLQQDKEKKKTANPEYVDDTKDTVFDAKYKHISDLNIENVGDNDINKLLRDMLVFQKNNGALVYPKPIAMLELENEHLAKEEQKTLCFLEPLQDRKLYLYWFPFCAS